ncbi:hypothetical protein [Propionibacterium sp.]|uniref:hypothetical protein n=1 Tax=Propionibacterium sp. TaxID=1977903 RepID=UPI0039EB433E
MPKSTSCPAFNKAIRSQNREAIARTCTMHAASSARLLQIVSIQIEATRIPPVDFLPDGPGGSSPYLSLKAELERSLGRDVDLVKSATVRHPYFAERSLRKAVDVYTARVPDSP